ncbi:MAG: DUF1554 domain-containing protein [Leptospiraceae bacterium]|nr:DUF1554 domain-containing protein [Leptospiraceae bacterium]
MRCFERNGVKFSSPTNGGDGTDWVFTANTQYFRAGDNAFIGTTTANRIFTLPLTNAFSTAGGFSWTYISIEWVSLEIGFAPPGLKCLEWTSSAGGDSGLIANPDNTGTGVLWNNTSQTCNNSHHLICVQQ